MVKRLQALLTQELIEEFLRYVLVGGTAFLVDYATLFILRQACGFSHLPAAAGGFCTGLAACYILSLVFVFESAKKEKKGRSVKDFIVFTIVGLIGLGLTLLGMWIGVDLLGFHYLLVKLPCTGIVLIWDFLARKILVFS